MKKVVWKDYQELKQEELTAEIQKFVLYMYETGYDLEAAGITSTGERDSVLYTFIERTKKLETVKKEVKNVKKSSRSKK